MQAHRFSLLLRNAYFAFRRKCNAICGELECNGDQFVILSVLAEREGVTQQDLVERSGYDPATTGKMLRLLEKRGLVARTAHPTDGRAKLVTLTIEGRSTWERLWGSTEKVRDTLWNCMNESERDVVAQNLTAIAQAMEKYSLTTAKSKAKSTLPSVQPSIRN